MSMDERQSIMPISSDELSHLSKEMLQNAYEDLLKQTQLQEQQIEDTKQEYHNLQRKIAENVALEKEYIEEIDFMKTGKGPECMEHSLEIQKVQEEKRICQKLHKSKLHSYEQKFTQIDADIEELEKHLQQLNSVAADAANVANEVISKETLQVKLINAAQELEHLCKQLEQKISANQSLESMINEANEELECLKETEQNTTAQLQEVKESIEELQAEVTYLRGEIDAKKSKPLDDSSRGNSHFTEVHDRKLELQSKFTFMKTHYSQLQSEYAQMIQQLNALTAENLRLSEIYNKEMSLEKEQYDRWRRYDEEIVQLKAQYLQKRNLFSEVKCKAKEMSEEEMRTLIRFYVVKEAKILKRLDELIECGEGQIAAAKTVADMNKEVRNLHFELSVMETEAIKLKVKQQAACAEKNIDLNCNCNELSGGILPHLTRSENIS